MRSFKSLLCLAGLLCGFPANAFVAKEGLSCPDASGRSFLRLTPELAKSLRELHPGDRAELTVPAEDLCLGADALLPLPAVELSSVSGTPRFRVRYLLDEFVARGDGRHAFRLRSGPWSQVLAPLCLDFCDGISSVEGALASGGPLIDLWRAQAIRLSGGGGIPSAKRISLDALSEKGIESLAASLRKDLPVHVIGESSSSERVIQAMRILKKRKLKTYWVYEGFLGEARPFPAPLLSGRVKVIGKEEHEALSARGYKTYFAGGSEELKRLRTSELKAPFVTADLLRWNNRSGPFFMFAAAGGYERFPVAGPPAKVRESVREVSFLVEELLPKDKKAPIVLIGSGRDDWRPGMIALHLMEKGFTDVRLREDGLAGR